MANVLSMGVVVQGGKQGHAEGRDVPCGCQRKKEKDSARRTATDVITDGLRSAAKSAKYQKKEMERKS